MQQLMKERYTIYAKANLTVRTSDRSQRWGGDKSFVMLTEECQSLTKGKVWIVSKKPTTVRIELGQASYDVVIGNQLMQDVGVWVTPRLNRKHTAIIMDTHVAELYGDELTATFNKHDISHQTIILQPGEQTKSFEQLQRLLNHLLEAKIERHDTIIAFGGGVIGDISVLQLVFFAVA